VIRGAALAALCLSLLAISPEPTRARSGSDRQAAFMRASGPCDSGESCDESAEFHESRDAAAEKAKWFQGQRQYPHDRFPRDAMRRAARYAKTIPSVRSLPGTQRSSMQSVPGDKKRARRQVGQPRARTDRDQ